MVAPEIGLEYLQKIPQGTPNVGAPTDVARFSATRVQLHTRRQNWKKLDFCSTDVTKATHKNRKERKGEKEEKRERMETST